VANRAVRHQHGDIDLVGEATGQDFGASTSIVTRWLRLVGAPKKRGAISPIRPEALAFSSCGSGNQLPLSVAEVCLRS